jgi:hypothetical protein
MDQLQVPSQKYQTLIWIKMLSSCVMIFFTLCVTIDIAMKMIYPDMRGIICRIVKMCCNYPLIGIVILACLCVSVYMFIMDRNFYLPFLGYSAYPCASLAEKTPLNPDVSVTVKVPPHVNVIYWASEPTSVVKEPVTDPWQAYALYENAGVAKSDANGVAVLQVRRPVTYNVPNMGIFGKKTLKQHVHYRYCELPGMLSEVKTTFV